MCWSQPERFVSDRSLMFDTARCICFVRTDLLEYLGGGHEYYCREAARRIDPTSKRRYLESIRRGNQWHNGPTVSRRLTVSRISSPQRTRTRNAIVIRSCLCGTVGRRSTGWWKRGYNGRWRQKAKSELVMT